MTGGSVMLMAGGIITFLFSVLILVNPIFGAMTLVLWTAIAFIITGLRNILLGYRLKSSFP